MHAYQHTHTHTHTRMHAVFAHVTYDMTYKDQLMFRTLSIIKVSDSHCHECLITSLLWSSLSCSKFHNKWGYTVPGVPFPARSYRAHP